MSKSLENNNMSPKIFEDLNDNSSTKIRIHIKESNEQAKKELNKTIKSKPLSTEEKVLAHSSKWQ